MKSMYDVQQLLLKFGMYVYMGDRLAELEIMESEIKELYRSQLIQVDDFQKAMLIIRRERANEEKTL